MAVDSLSNLALAIDAPLHALAYRGHGAHYRPGDIPWAASGVVTTPDGRATILPALQSLDGWRTTTTGLSARRRLSDWTGTDDWTEAERYAAGDWWLYAESDTPGAVTTAGANWSGASAGLLTANPHLFVEAWAFGAHDDPAEILRLDWGNAKWRLILYGTGAVVLQRDQGDGLQTVASGTPFGRPIVHEPFRLQISPLVRRCLYVFGSGGGHIRYEDLDLDPAAADYVAATATEPLIPGGALTVTAARRVLLQISECVFSAAGTLRGTAYLPDAPPAGSALAFTGRDGSTSLHWYDASDSTALTVEAKDASDTVWAADGSSTTVPLLVTLTPSANNRRTPQFYGAGLRVAATRKDRAGTVVDALSLVPAGEMTYDVDEDKSSLTLPLMDATLEGKLNRAVVLTVGDETEFDGYTSRPETDATDPRGTVTFTVEDAKKRADNVLLPSTEAFDGQKLTDVVATVIEYMGYDPDTELSIQDSDFLLPKKAANQDGDDGSEPLVKPGTGERAGEFLSYLAESYSNNWRIVRQSVAGTVKWVVGDEDFIASLTGAGVTLYDNTAAAVAAGKTLDYVVRQWKSAIIEPEANEFLVVGEDAGGRPISATWRDAASQDPDLEEGARPSNWIGEPRLYVYVDSSLNTEALVNQALAYLVKRGAYAMERVSMETEWHPQLRRRAKVTINGTEYRVVNYRARLSREAVVSGLKHRPCEYTLERTLAP